MRALVTGDDHMGKSQDLGRVPGERLAEQEANWAARLELSRSLKVDVVVHLGDLFDGRRPGPDVMLAAERPLVQHQEQGGSPVMLVSGNHEVPSQDGPSPLEVLAEAGLIELAREPRVWGVEGVALCALPWTPVARLLSQRDGVPREQVFEEAAELVVQVARDLKAQCIVGDTAILLGHWAVSQTLLPNGLDVSSLAGVVLPMDDLLEIGFDWIGFGHIHNAGTYGDGSFFYTGSPMPLDFGEASQRHGCWLLDTAAAAVPEFLALPFRPFVTLNTLAVLPDVTDAFVKVRDTVTEEERGKMDLAQLERDLIEHHGAYRVWFDITVERQRRERGVVLSEGLSRQQQLAAYLDAVGVNGSVGAAMLETSEAYI